MNGKRVSITGPAGMVTAAPLPVSPQLGCALLPQSLALGKLAAGKATLSSDPQTGLPASLAWSARGSPTALAYTSYQSDAGVTFPTTVTETVAGKRRLAVHLVSVAPHAFTESDFALPPLPKNLAGSVSRGGQ